MYNSREHRNGRHFGGRRPGIRPDCLRPGHGCEQHPGSDVCAWIQPPRPDPRPSEKEQNMAGRPDQGVMMRSR